MSSHALADGMDGCVATTSLYPIFSSQNRLADVCLDRARVFGCLWVPLFMMGYL